MVALISKIDHFFTEKENTVDGKMRNSEEDG